MELPTPNNSDSRLRQMAKTYSEAIRIGAVFVGWTLVAFVVGSAAFVVIKVGWTFLMLILRAVGEI